MQDIYEAERRRLKRLVKERVLNRRRNRGRVFNNQHQAKTPSVLATLFDNNSRQGRGRGIKNCDMNSKTEVR